MSRTLVLICCAANFFIAAHEAAGSTQITMSKQEKSAYEDAGAAVLQIELRLLAPNPLDAACDAHTREAFVRFREKLRRELDAQVRACAFLRCMHCCVGWGQAGDPCPVGLRPCAPIEGTGALLIAIPICRSRRATRPARGLSLCRSTWPLPGRRQLRSETSCDTWSARSDLSGAARDRAPALHGIRSRTRNTAV